VTIAFVGAERDPWLTDATTGHTMNPQRSRQHDAHDDTMATTPPIAPAHATHVAFVVTIAFVVR
jgi:hypothetical protein